MFERSTDRGWYNLSGTSFDDWGGWLEQITWVMVTQKQEKLSVNNQQLFIETQWCNNILSSTDSFVVSQLISVARHVGMFKLGLKPAQLYIRLSIIPLSH